MAQVSDPNRPIPQKTFKDTYTLRSGNQTLELSYKGANHLEGNIFIFVPAQKVLMLVDVIYPGWTPFAQLGQVKNVAKTTTGSYPYHMHTIQSMQFRRHQSMAP